MNDTVVIVDDSLTVRMDLAEAFTAAGFDARPCASLAEARTAADGTAPAAWILDVRLPDGDGVDLLRDIRHAAAAPPPVVVMLSSEAEVGDRIRGLRTGADEYVGKPYDLAYVVGRVGELLRERTRHDTAATTILVIDDSVTFREALRASLESADYRVCVAGTGEEGLRLAGADRPDAVIVDGMLPGIDGATVIRRLRLDARLRDLPCLLLTGSEDRGAELLALDAGADSFLRKGEDVTVILARLAAVLRQASARLPGVDTRSVLGPKTILAVDDEPAYLRELTDALKGEGYAIMCARSAEDALELLAVQPVDCILLDQNLSGLGGEDTCRHIKDAPVVGAVPIVLLAPAEDRGTLIDGLAAGADDVVGKAAGFEVLKARVRAQLRRRQVEDERRRIREELLRKELEATEARAAQTLAETRAALVEELERKNRELEAFSYSVSHDLRAPLRSISGFSRVLLEDVGDLPPSTSDLLRRIGAAARRMGELIDDLLELSRVSNATLQREPTDLADIARDVIATLRDRHPDRTVDVVMPDTLTADADRRLLRVVFENLIGNSWKFTGRTPGARIEIGTRADADGETVFFIRDNGAGFDMAYAEKLFRPFQRLHSTAEFEGTGVGLATVQRIVDRHGGRVWAEGIVGQGAGFFFTLPPARVIPT